MVNGSFWLSLLVIVATILFKDVLVTSYWRLLYPTPAQIIQEVSIAFILAYKTVIVLRRAIDGVFAPQRRRLASPTFGQR
jgi:hypothetical protein